MKIFLLGLRPALVAAAIAAGALLSLAAQAASDAAWSEFRTAVEEACIAAAGEAMTNPSVTVDPFGSASYGMALLRDLPKDGEEASVAMICVYDKAAKTAEIGSELDLGMAADESADGAGEVPTADYRCEDGTHLSVRFEDDLAVVRTDEGEELRLPQQRAASGIWYASGQEELRGKGREATWTAGGRAPVTCTAP